MQMTADREVDSGERLQQRRRRRPSAPRDRRARRRACRRRRRRRAGRARSRNDSTSAIVNLPALRIRSASSSTTGRKAHGRGEPHPAVEAVEEDEAREAEERRRRQIVAGHGEAVLQAGDSAARGPELGGRARALGRPVGDPERHREHAAKTASGSACRSAARTVIARPPRPGARAARASSRRPACTARS